MASEVLEMDDFESFEAFNAVRDTHASAVELYNKVCVTIYSLSKTRFGHKFPIKGFLHGLLITARGLFPVSESQAASAMSFNSHPFASYATRACMTDLLEEVDMLLRLRDRPVDSVEVTHHDYALLPFFNKRGKKMLIQLKSALITCLKVSLEAALGDSLGLKQEATAAATPTKLKFSGLKVATDVITRTIQIRKDNGRGTRKVYCQYRIPLPRGSHDAEERRRLMVVNTRKRFQGCHTLVLELNDGTCEQPHVTQTFELSTEFLVAYFERMPTAKMTTTQRYYVFGSRQCNTCDSFHHLERITDASRAYVKQRQTGPSPDELWFQDNVFLVKPNGCQILKAIKAAAGRHDQLVMSAS